MKRRTYIGCLLALTLILLNSCFEDSEKLHPNTPIGNFETLWEIIDTKYCYLDYKNIDWSAIGEQYRREVEDLGDTPNKRLLFNVFASMLDSLRDGHVNLYSNFDVSNNTAWYEDRPKNFDASILYGSNYLGKDYKRAGGMHYTKLADGKVGYIYYKSFSNSFSSANLANVFDYFSDCNGLIVDVRDNGGGNMDNSMMLAAAFFQKETLVGYRRHKTDLGHSDFSEMSPMYIYPSMVSCKWLRPVVILSNRESYSATNMFICNMKEAPNATIMGGASGGGGGMPVSYELPNGWIIRFSALPMYDKNGQNIEDGIAPDIEVNTTPMMLLGYDDIIEAAVQQIISEGD